MIVPGSLVIVNLQSPSERFVGRLIEIAPPGVTVRGIDLESFEDWINGVANDESTRVYPSTVFFPLHRVEKMLLDEDVGEIPSLAGMFLERIGWPIDKYL